MGIKVTYTFFSLLSCFHFSLVSQVFISIHGVVSSRLFLASCIVRKNFIVLLKKAIQIRKRSEIYSMYLVPFIHCPKSYVVSLLHTHTCGFKAALTHTKWNKVGGTLFGTLYPYEYKMGIKKVFHQWTSKLPDSVYSQSSLDGLDRPCILACSSEVQ